MKSKKAKKNTSCERTESKGAVVSYHLKCAKTSNGLTHFVMYGDVPKKKMPL